MTIADRILDTRERQNLTLQQFAKKVGSTRQMVWKYESGEKTPSVKRAYAWAKKLGADPVQWVTAVLQQKVHESGLSFKVRVKEGR